MRLRGVTRERAAGGTGGIGRGGADLHERARKARASEALHLHAVALTLTALLSCSAPAPAVRERTHRTVVRGPGTAPAESAPVTRTQRDTDAPSTAPAAPMSPASPASTEERLLSGTLDTRYRGRWASDDSDSKLWEVVSLSYGDAERTPWSAHVLATGVVDLDGRPNDGSSVFYSLADTYDARLLRAYVDVHRPRSFDLLRIGRQLVYETPVTVAFDGVRLETNASDTLDARFGLYGGIPVYHYESSSDGDGLFGAHATANVWEGAELRLDYMHIEDEHLMLDKRADLWSGTLRQRLEHGERQTDLDLQYTGLDGSERDVRLAASYYDAEHRFGFDASYYELLTTLLIEPVPLDPFFSSLFALFPYYEIRMLASKAWDDVQLQGGANVRQVTDSDDVGEFNRDFERYHVTTTLPDLLHSGVDLSATGELWRSDRTDFDTYGLDLSRRLDERFDLSLGSYYSLYKYDFFLNEERDNVRTYYTLLRYRPRVSTTWSFGYELENNDFDDFHRVRVALTWTF